MNITRQQRDELCQLSSKVWGSKYQWRKLMNSASFQVPVGTREVYSEGYVRRGGTVLKRSTAEDKGLVKPSENSGPRYEVVRRRPTVDELFFVMNRIIDERALLYLRNTHDLNTDTKKLMIPHVYNLINQTLEYPFNGFVLTGEDTDEYRNTLSETTSLMSEATKVTFESIDVENNKPDTTVGIPFDAIEFAKEVVSAEGDFKRYTTMYQAHMVVAYNAI